MEFSHPPVGMFHAMSILEVQLIMNIEFTKQQKDEVSRLGLIVSKKGRDCREYRELSKYLKIMLYSIPMKYKLIDEENLSDFYCMYEKKIDSYYTMFDEKKGPFFSFFTSIIWNWSYFYKLRLNKKTNDEAIKQNIYHISQITEEDYSIEPIGDNQCLMSKVYYDRVCESSPEYNRFSSYPELDSLRNKQLKRDFNRIIKAKRSKINCEIDNPFFKKLYSQMDSKVIRRRILIYIMIFPDIILDNYTMECSQLFSVNEEIIIELLSTSRLLFTDVKDTIEEEKERSAKLMMRILELRSMKDYSTLYTKKEIIQDKIENTTRTYNHAIQHIAKLNNRHISQRTLAAALDIKSGTVASSILLTKRLLKECCNDEC